MTIKFEDHMIEHTVIITEPIHQSGIELLERNNIEVIQLPPGSDEDTLQSEAHRAIGLITRGGIKVTKEFIESASSLVAIGVHGIGCDHVDLDTARKLGKVVLNTPYALSDSVAEMVIALLFAISRRVVSADKAVRAGEWNRKYSDLRGIEIMGKVVGIIGLGRIGVATARRLKSFGVKQIYFSRTRKIDIEDELDIKYVSLNKLIQQSDIIILSLPYRQDTHHLINAERIEAMKNGVYIVNTARGKIIDQDALVNALETGKVAAAGLDVFENEPLDPNNVLATLDNVVLTPHLAASSEEAMERMAIQVAEGVLKALNGESPDYLVVI
jgi:D-3-phosphoglycerate dehydrogenase